MFAPSALCVEPDASRHIKYSISSTLHESFPRFSSAARSPEGRDLIETLARLEIAQRNFGYE